MSYNAAHLRRRNVRRVVEHLLYHQRASRAELSSQLRTAKPTISQIVSDLMELQVVRELDINADAARMPGRPSTPVELDGELGRLILIQIGVNNTRIALSPARLDIDADWQAEFATPDSTHKLVDCIFKELSKLDDKHAWGMVVSIPGVVDDEAGDVFFCPNLRWLNEEHLPTQLKINRDLPVLLIQEIRALALGEHLATGLDNFLHVDIDTGVGGAAILRSKLYDAPGPLTIELGHNIIAGNKRLCGCGNVGCLETVLGKPGLLQTFGNATGDTKPSWVKLLKSLELLELTDGTPQWLAPTLLHAAQIIGGAMNILGVNDVVITGLLTDFPQHCLDDLAQHIQKNCMAGQFGKINTIFAPHRRLLGMAAVGVDRILIPHLTSTTEA
jgi:predicted NBD/HSP70 family sugar kinase